MHVEKLPSIISYKKQALKNQSFCECVLCEKNSIDAEKLFGENIRSKKFFLSSFNMKILFSFLCLIGWEYNRHLEIGWKAWKIPLKLCKKKVGFKMASQWNYGDGRFEQTYNIIRLKEKMPLKRYNLVEETNI